MSPLREALAEYLAVRRAVGYKLVRDERLLGQFINYLETRGERQITTDRAVAWATLPQRGKCWHSQRLQAVRSFARHLHAIDLHVQVPPADLLPSAPHRAVPYLYTDVQIAALMQATETLRTAHRAATYRTLLGLLFVTGLRIGEAVALDCRDLDRDQGVLLVCGKFSKLRELPLDPSTVDALSRYLERTDRPRPPAPTDALFVSGKGKRLLHADVQWTFRKVRDRAGIRPRAAACRPRIHDARHSYAVHTILDAYRDGGDVGQRLALISTYLGHVNPTNTYWYLSAAPELMELAAKRLEHYLEETR